MLLHTLETLSEIAETTLDTTLLIASHTVEITDFIEFIVVEINPEIFVHTAFITFEIAEETIEIIVDTAFQITSNVFFMPSSSGVRNETMLFQIFCIFSEIQSITLLMITLTASKIVSKRYAKASSSGEMKSYTAFHTDEITV